MTRQPLALIAVLLLSLLTAACADGIAVGSGDPTVTADPPEPADTPIPVEPDGGIGDGAGPPEGQLPADGDAPIPVEPDGGIGDGAGPPGELAEVPSFGVSSETESLSVRPDSSCWSADGQGICADGFPTPREHPITAAEQLVVTFEPGQLQATAIPLDPGADQADPNAAQTALPLVEENPGIWLVPVTTLDPGTYQLTLFWNGDQGDAAGTLALTIEGP